MNIRVATIEHKHGCNFYAATTDELLTNQLADYCREWWNEELLDEVMPTRASEIVDAYFTLVESEFLNRDETELVGA